VFFDLDFSSLDAGTIVTLTMTVGDGQSASSVDLFPPGATIFDHGPQTDSICYLYDQDPGTELVTNCAILTPGTYRLGVEGNWFSPQGSQNTFVVRIGTDCP